MTLEARAAGCQIQAESHQTGIPAGRVRMAKKQIMVVDDEPGILLLLEITLKRWGFTVVKVGDPHRALSLLDYCTPDLFILDVMMPGMDGMELCKKIRSRPETETTPVILFSAYNGQKMIDQGIAAGATACISKSAQHELYDRVRSLLAN